MLTTKKGHKPPPSNGVNPVEHKTLCFDWEDFLPYLAEIEGTEAQKRELVEKLWQIILAFVDMGWEVGSPQQTLGRVTKQVPGQTVRQAGKLACEQDIDLTAVLKAAVVQLEDNQQRVEAKERV